ncbi:MAG: outer membrane lipid asymmetry maintenance protein MlaD [Opitutales bacterium]|jgi:phospholipid/cholesterol/gamma-HCH transport system substrate-binding protein|nr:outer membrane lipid asymmetry maintenance protein MlaD [Opitutales bacterium]MDP4644368.1 outer membrane lipid asymmetry maintenance protein MlaD [Opitutales bacterium]MDP4693310.1 outer membrane lipid asymmetry maintenance protein MlaD [Opitutales bacterium]MDP4777834.1 outer membrane lipid asymmetry maintenance protein MlaD [Opitutales bacterium]MDP4879914.1 outer membrane lipid asymmetry maintenance protein MlaD [Opitutales bacterium]
MNNRKIEFLVGCFVLVGLGAVLYLAIQVGSARFYNSDSYELKARFSSISGVNTGSRIEIAGVRVGTVTEIVLNDDFFAILTLELPNSIQLDDDTIASVKTAGLIGDRYINLSPGGSGLPLEPGDTIVDTESAMDIEGLISRFALGGIDEEEE